MTTEQHLFEIAKIIDPVFILNKEQFVVDYVSEGGYYRLSTKFFKQSTSIRIWCRRDDIKNYIDIQIMGEHTEGWDNLDLTTFNKVNQYLNSIK